MPSIAAYWIAFTVYQPLKLVLEAVELERKRTDRDKFPC